MHRRKLLMLLAAGAATPFLFSRLSWGTDMPPAITDNTTDKLVKTDSEWKAMLTPEQYDVLRHEGTERPGTSALLDEHRSGTFVCAGCGLTLFPSRFKFDSGTGWPSFFDSLPGHVETRVDHKLIVPRTEYHCARCGGHQGHVFHDGPAPTGLRYCNNGIALRFVPDARKG